MEKITLTCAVPIPDYWNIGDKIITLVGHYRILAIPDDNTIVVRKWRWYDYVALVWYAVKLLWKDIKEILWILMKL